MVLWQLSSIILYYFHSRNRFYRTLYAIRKWHRTASNDKRLSGTTLPVICFSAQCLITFTMPFTTFNATHSLMKFLVSNNSSNRTTAANKCSSSKVLYVTMIDGFGSQSIHDFPVRFNSMKASTKINTPSFNRFGIESFLFQRQNLLLNELQWICESV